jgi:hypothetical protein
MLTSHKKEFEPEFEHTKKNPTLPELFPHLHNQFKSNWGHLPDEAFNMLTRKGVYPYEYMNSFDKFKETELPPKSKFYNRLAQKHISDADYKFIHQLWVTFQLKDLGELHDLYMETDTLLLTDVFENYREGIQKSYGLDPAHFYTAPALSWAAGLKYTKAKLEIPLDVDMHIFFDRGLRGGISMVANHFAKANNPHLKEMWNPLLEQSFIEFVDANNLYGWAMSQCLPTGGFKWVRDLKQDHLALKHGARQFKKMDEWEHDICSLDDEGAIGYFF